MFKLTDEQLQIIQTFDDDKNVKIYTFAGTGKTFTLGKIAKKSEKSGLYVAFNRAIADEAKSLMPKNVHVSTAHSLAFKWARTKYEIDKLINNPNQKLIRYFMFILRSLLQSLRQLTLPYCHYYLVQRSPNQRQLLR
jgi:superfamily I DNA/RNA helicase